MNRTTAADKRRRYLKAYCRRSMVGRRDRIAEGATPRWRAAFVLASLQACAQRMGWDHKKVCDHIYPMADRIPAIVLHGRA